jgi:glycosyltransferase involved in cell wall biosynthesis
MRTLGIVIPAFRPECGRLSAFVRALEEQLSPAEILIELDDPLPGTVEALSDLPASVDVVPYRRGKGAAITAGFEALDTDVLAFVDADGSTPTPSVAAMIEPVREGRAAVGIGSRRHPDAAVEGHQTRIRRRMGDAFAWLARRLLAADLYDYQCGAKAITADAWAEVRQHLYEPGFAWDVEFVAISAALGYRIEGVPVTWRDQPESTVSPIRTALSLGRSLVAVRRRANRLHNSHLSALPAPDESTALVDREFETER